jgi:hypothetical protein
MNIIYVSCSINHINYYEDIIRACICFNVNNKIKITLLGLDKIKSDYINADYKFKSLEKVYKDSLYNDIYYMNLFLKKYKDIYYLGSVGNRITIKKVTKQEFDKVIFNRFYISNDYINKLDMNIFKRYILRNKFAYSDCSFLEYFYLFTTPNLLSLRVISKKFLNELLGGILSKSKNIIKVLIKKIFSYRLKNDTRIILSSTGRGGSTLLVKSLCDAIIDKKKISCPQLLPIYQFCRNLSNYDEKFIITKTHDFFNETKNVKYIFLYSNKKHIYNSFDKIAKNENFIFLEKHLYNLDSKKNYVIDKNNLFNYTKLKNDWLKRRAQNNILVISYENLWDCIDLINNFTDLKVKLPKQIKC